MESEMVSLVEDGLRLRTKAHPQLRAQALDVLGTCAKLARTPKGIHDRTLVQFGGPLFVLRRDETGFRVCEPGYGKADPRTDAYPDISRSLTLLSRQVAFAEKLGAEPVDCSWTHTFLSRIDLDWNADLYLERTEPNAESGVSGWYIGPAIFDDDTALPPRADELRSEPIYILLERRPALMVPLISPPGTLVVFEGDEIIGVDCPKGS